VTAACRYLAEMYGSFTAGFDTANRRNAKELLDDLK